MANFSLPLYGQKGFGKKTASANTAYLQLIEPKANAFCGLTFLQFTTLATAHVLTVMRPLSSTTLAADAAASQAVINLAADPGTTGYYASATKRTANNPIAANDYLVYQCPDGTWVLDKVASVATLAITMTTNVPTNGVKAGSPVWFMGITTDTNPIDAAAQPQFNLALSSTVNIGSENGPIGWISTYNRGEPLVLSVDNATNASVLERGTACYSDRGSPYV